MEDHLNNRFYVYRHVRKDGRTFYVGKGTGGRCNSEKRRNQHWQRIASAGFESEILFSSLAEECAFCIEKIMISAIGRKNLCNMTDGGEGTSGWIPSQKFRSALSRKMKGKPMPQVRTPEAKAKRAASLRGRQHTDEHREKIARAQRGKYKGGKVMHFYHPIHGEKITTASLLRGEFGLNRNISGVASGRCKSSQGWCLYENRGETGHPCGGLHHMADGQIYKFRHADGRIYTGSRYEFSKFFDLSLQGIGKMVRGDKPSYKGWRLAQ